MSGPMITVNRREVENLLQLQVGEVLAAESQHIADLLIALERTAHLQPQAAKLLDSIREIERAAYAFCVAFAEREEHLRDLDLLLDECAMEGGDKK